MSNREAIEIIGETRLPSAVGFDDEQN